DMYLIVDEHLIGVISVLTMLSYRTQELGVNVACYVHTHIAEVNEMNNQLFINPGSIHLPRNRSEITYCIMKWDDTQHIDIRYYTVNGEEVEDLSRVISLK